MIVAFALQLLLVTQLWMLLSATEMSSMSSTQPTVYEYEYEFEESDNIETSIKPNIVISLPNDGKPIEKSIEIENILDEHDDRSKTSLQREEADDSLEPIPVFLNNAFSPNDQNDPRVESGSNSKTPIDLDSLTVVKRQDEEVTGMNDSSIFDDFNFDYNDTNVNETESNVPSFGGDELFSRLGGVKLPTKRRRPKKMSTLSPSKVDTDVDPTHPPRVGNRSTVEEPTDYFISEGADDTEEEGRKSDAIMLEDYNYKKFYFGCGDDKGCFGGPRKNCLALKACDMAVAYEPRPQDGGVHIEILARSPKYIAVGLSADTKMGGDNVIDCVRENDEIRIYRSRNKGRRNYRLTDHSAIFNLVGHFTNEWLYCSVILKKITVIRINGTERFFDLEKQRYHFLLARGNSADYREDRVGIGFHDLGTLASPRMYNLMEFGETKVRRIFEKLHGICILVGWMLLLPISTFVIRYFKNTCNEKFVGNLSIWFAVHVILNGIVVGLTVASMLFIIVTNNNFLIGGKGWTYHNVCALVLCACVLLQIFFGIRIYSKRHGEHGTSSSFHAILGHITFLLSYFIIYKSKDIRHGLPCNSFPILVTWIVLYFAIHLVLSYQVCYVDFIHGLESSRIYRFSGLAPTPVTDVDPEPPGGVVRKALLWTLIVVCLVTTGSLLGLYIAGFPDCIRKAENQ